VADEESDMATRLHLCILLHMHQPFYKTLRDGIYHMPWARLHALRNYYDMPALQEEFPGLNITWNLVPGLVEQLRDYAAGASDGFEAVSRIPAADLDEGQKRFLLSNFFQLNRRWQIDEFPRFRELLEMKGSADRAVDDRAVKRFGARECLDLQVLFNLAWSGWTIRSEPAVAALMDKGRDFSEAEKTALLDIQRAFLPKVLEPYARLARAGAAEITTTPFYHPILPLLCDLESAREALPAIHLPESRFLRPGDAAGQVRDGIEYLERETGIRARGMWPSEGSVSAAACAIMAEAGITWAGTDRVVLSHSLGRAPLAEELYAPHRFDTPAGPLHLFFRDTQLSDLPGFVYQAWPAPKAAKDFVSRLRAIADAAPAGRTPVVNVFLDGENAWGGYEDNGRPFLRALYAEIMAASSWLQTVTPGRVLSDKLADPKPLPRLVAGSWIYGALNTWIGHAEKNRAWDVLAPARAALDHAEQVHSGAPVDLPLARKEMVIAEGSDWFWWFGDDHVTSYAAEFDRLFREHVMNVWRALGQEPPAYLLEPIKKVAAGEEIRPPLRLIHPRLEGRESRYHEWLNAGYYAARGGAGSMHQTAGLIAEMLFGYDTDRVYVRFDGRVPFDERPLPGYQLRLLITAPVAAEIAFDFESGAPPSFRRGDGAGETLLEYGFERILEIAIPWDLLGAADKVAFYAILIGGGHEVERHPRGRTIEISRHGAEFDTEMWTV
jgi:alpha-amylase/alpha-mannosidase (GH57 family)